MIDLTTLPLRLAPILSDEGPVTILRAQHKHANALAVAGKLALSSVKPWMGTSLVPTTTKSAEKVIAVFEQQRRCGFGVTYLLMCQQRCLGMGILNYIHPTHGNANLGFWLVPEARGRGLAFILCQRLIELATQPLGLHRLEFYILPDNQPSIKLASALGAEKEGLCRQRILKRDALLYSLLL